MSDLPFIGLYGPSRLWHRRVENSIALFRRVKPVLVADNAGPDLVAFAVEEADARPFCVIFPYRYVDGGRRYAGQFPEVPVIILDTRPEGAPSLSGPPGESPDSGRLITLKTRRQEDFFRAGFMAGCFFRAGEAGETGAGGGILVFQEKSLSRADKDALMAGVRKSEVDRLPLFLNSPAEYGGLAEASCVILSGPAAEFLDRSLAIPQILFSWLDPAMTPGETLVIFDDSPWALAPEAVRLAVRGTGDRKDAISSDIIFPRGRIADKKLLKDFRRSLQVSLPEG